MPASKIVNKPAPGPGENAVAAPWQTVFFAAACGGLFGLALLKFGNPVILDRLIEVPRNGWEYLFQPWPVRWGYGLLLVCLVAGLGVLRCRVSVPKWVVVLPCVWFGWQVISASGTIEPKLTGPTLLHFGACLACFFLGLLGLGRLRIGRAFWIPVLVGFLWVLWMGFEQHYGGLEATRKAFYEQPDWQGYPPDYLKKLQSNRIFSTLVYPNALAAAILLLLPALLLTVWRLAIRLTDLSRAVLVGVVAYAGAACLYWSGSKSGWLIALAMLVMAGLLRLPLATRTKASLLGTLILIGMAGFFVKYAPYFQKGAPSVSARFEYWRAAARTAAENPVFGTGPGTFSVAYRQIKPPDAEMAQLVHNDYLEQASDSGVVGFLSFTAFVMGSIVLLPRRGPILEDNRLFTIWLGLLGWSLQSAVEFLLYIPALAWPAFALLGWLWASSSNIEFDSPDASW